MNPIPGTLTYLSIGCIRGDKRLWGGDPSTTSCLVYMSIKKLGPEPNAEPKTDLGSPVRLLGALLTTRNITRHVSP